MIYGVECVSALHHNKCKTKLFKQEHYLNEAKRFYTDLINLLIEDDKDKLHVFDKNGLYLATKKISKNNPKAEHGEKVPKPETMQEKLQRYKEQTAQQNTNQPYRSRDKGAR